jgi:LysM repeat protein
MSRLGTLSAGAMLLAVLSGASVLTPVAAAAAAPTQHVTYQVRRGDSLWRIARRNHTTVAKLVQQNAAQHPSLRRNPRLIRAGWHLTVQ